jgi:hypothetical protein
MPRGFQPYAGFRQGDAKRQRVGRPDVLHSRVCHKQCHPNGRVLVSVDENGRRMWHAAPEGETEAHHSGLAEQCAPLYDAPGGCELEVRKAIKV